MNPRKDSEGNFFAEINPEGVEASVAGTKLANGHFLVLFGLKGDLDYYAKLLRLRHYNAKFLCDLCPAGRLKTLRALCYTNFGADATWPHCQFTIEEWRALYHELFLHWVFHMKGVCQVMLEPDELHVLYLGIFQ